MVDDYCWEGDFIHLLYVSLPSFTLPPCQLTTYTVLMQVNSGKMETYRMTCPGFCWPF